MKMPKKKRVKDDLAQDVETEMDDGRPVPFGALAELTSSEVIAQVKMGMANIEPLEFRRRTGRRRRLSARAPALAVLRASAFWHKPKTSATVTAAMPS